MMHINLAESFGPRPVVPSSLVYRDEVPVLIGLLAFILVGAILIGNQIARLPR